MVQPVTGPFVMKSINRPGLYDYQSGWRQKPPFTLRLPYQHRTTLSNNPYNSPASYAIEPQVNSWNLCSNKAYARFFDKIRNLPSQGQAGWLMSLTQHQQARAMFNKRCTNLLEYVTRLERNFRKDRRRATTRDWASVFLEARFGWLPILSDIYATMEILNSKPKADMVRSSASSPYYYSLYSEADWSVRASFKGKLRVSMLADVQVSNPNLYLLNQMGLINPLVVAWDVVPWGFVLDWWLNLNQVANSFTDTYGLTLSNAVTTRRFGNSGTWGYFRPKIGLVDNYQYRTESIHRVTGITGPTLALKPFTGLSLVRGTTALALVLQKLPDRAPFRSSR